MIREMERQAMGWKREQRKRTSLFVRISQEQKEKLASLARKEELSLNELVVRLIENL